MEDMREREKGHEREREMEDMRERERWRTLISEATLTAESFLRKLEAEL